MAAQADGLTTLTYWARNLKVISAPLSSPAAEAILFQAEVDRLAGLDTFEALARHFDARLASYQAHAKAFWGHRAGKKVRWTHLAELASIAAVLDSMSGSRTGGHPRRTRWPGSPGRAGRSTTPARPCSGKITTCLAA